jgi:hypothetical protein
LAEDAGLRGRLADPGDTLGDADERSRACRRRLNEHADCRVNKVVVPSGAMVDRVAMLFEKERALREAMSKKASS